MDDNWKVLKAVAYQAEIEAMKADNKQRELNGEALAWSYSDFMNISNQIHQEVYQ